MMGARIINRRPLVVNPGVFDALDIQREGFKRSEELRRSTGVSGKQVARESADAEFETWWNYGGFEDSFLPKGEAKKEWLKGFRGRGWGSHNPKYVTQRDVDAAAQSYHNNMMAYGENNMATQRAEWKYRELQRTYNEQKAKRKERAENPAWFGYHPRFVPEHLWNELVNLWHLSRVPFSGVREGARYKRMIWTSGEFHKEHPEISSTAAYKDLDGFLAYSGK